MRNGVGKGDIQRCFCAGGDGYPAEAGPKLNTLIAWRSGNRPVAVLGDAGNLIMALSIAAASISDAIPARDQDPGTLNRLALGVQDPAGQASWGPYFGLAHYRPPAAQSIILQRVAYRPDGGAIAQKEPQQPCTKYQNEAEEY